MKSRILILTLFLAATGLWADEPVVGLYSGAGADSHLRAVAGRMFRWMGCQTVLISAADINQGTFRDIDIIYFAGGSTGPIRRDITEAGRENLRNHIRGGCGYIGTCGGALMACERNLWMGHEDDYGLFRIAPVTGIGPVQELDGGESTRMMALDVNREWGGKSWELYGIDPSLPAYVLSINSPWFDTGDSGGVVVVARYAGCGKPAYVACGYGAGRVFLTGPHPEIEEDDNRDGNSYFDYLEDSGSDWPLMQMAVEWCLDGGRS